MASISPDRFHYLPTSPVERDWGFFVTTVGDDRIAPHTPYPPPRHPSGYYFSWAQGRILHEFQIVYITQGQGTFESRLTKPRRIKAGDVLLLFPDVWHRYTPDRRSGWHEHWVGFDGDYARHLMDKNFFSPHSPILRTGLDEALLEQFNQILELAHRAPLGYQQRMAATTLQILAHLHSALRAQTAGGSHTEATIRQAKCLLLENLDRPLDTEQLARNLHVGYSWFRQMFRHHTGLSPSQYHLQLRLNRAQALLRTTDLSIKSISSLLGFESPYYFSRLFKKKTRQSPSRWRTRSCPRRVTSTP